MTTPTPWVDMSIPGFSNNGPPATEGTTGAPGTWAPPLAEPPNTFALMGTVTASPTTKWIRGQYVILKDGTFANWDGVAWASGKAK